MTKRYLLVCDEALFENMRRLAISKDRSVGYMIREAMTESVNRTRMYQDAKGRVKTWREWECYCGENGLDMKELLLTEIT